MKRNNKIKFLVLSASLLLAACAPAASSSSNSKQDAPSSQTTSNPAPESSKKSSENPSSVAPTTSSITTSSGTTQKGVFVFDDAKLNTEQKIHTSDQQKMLDWGKTHKFYTELNSSVLTSLGAPGTQEKSHPEQVSLSWDYNAPDGKTISNYSIMIGQKNDLSDGFIIKGTSAKSLKFYNAFIGTNYFKVIANFSDGSNQASDIKTFKVDATAPRVMKMGTMSNCRDMGGRSTVAGGKIKQGLIYRTADPENKVDNELKEVLLNQLKVKTEIYVKDGKNTSSPLGSSIKYFNCSMDYGTGSYSNLSRNAERIRKVFSILVDQNNYPTFYHCRIGTDRTGIVAILLNGLLGVDFNEIIGDHAFSNYAPIDGQRYANSTKVTGQDKNGDDIAKYVDEILALPGKNFQEQCYYALLSIGIPKADLVKIIDFLTEGPKATLPDNIAVGMGNDLTTTNASKKTCADYTHPATYYEVTNGKSVSYKINLAKAGKVDVIAYMGNKTKSTSIKIADGISLKIDDQDQKIIDKNHELAGFGVTGQNGRTGYMFNQLGQYDLAAGGHIITISGKSSQVFNLAVIDVINL